MSDVKISVIVPVYKVEKYIGKAIESILGQTLSDFELLLVDDGSPDRSGEICDEYAKKDSRIEVIHKENGGAPSARNVAIDQAKGKYLFFMDADDWAEKDMLQSLYDLAERDQSQLVVCGFYIDTYSGKDTGKYISEKICVDDCVYRTAQEFRNASHKYYDRNMLYTPWNKLYLKEYIYEKNLRFPNVFWDDFPFNLSVVYEVERVTVTTKAFYHFLRARSESESSLYNPTLYQKREEEHDWLEKLYASWGIQSSEVKEMLARRYIERVVGCFENLTSSKCTLKWKEKRVEVKKILANPRVEANLKVASPRSAYMRLLLIPVRWKNVTLILLEGSMITFVKEHFSLLFAKLKAGR